MQMYHILLQAVAKFVCDVSILFYSLHFKCNINRKIGTVKII